MKKILLLTLFFLNFSYFCFSQDDRTRRAEEIQRNYLKQQLGLTPDEEQRFWPVFSKYKSEIRQARTEGRGNVIATNEKIVAIQKEYQNEFKKVFPDQKRVDKIFTADQNFRDLMRKELETRNKGNDNSNKPEKQPKGKKN